jgi:hypothetical protein
MNRKLVSSVWVLYKIDTSYETDEDTDMNDEEYQGNYTFVVIEEDKKKCKAVNLKSNLQIDENFEDE